MGTRAALSRLLAACALGALCGCGGIGDSSYNTRPYERVASAEAFVGDYQNLGEEPHQRSHPIYLSRLIWPKMESDLDARIRTVEVRSAGKDKLLVRGLAGDGTVVQSGTFEEGRDFHLRDGVIQLSQETSGAAAMWPLPVLAVNRESVELGVDQDGNAQRVRRETKAGILVVMPVAGTDSQGVTFRRLRK